MRPADPVGDGPQGQLESRQTLRRRAYAGQATPLSVTGGPPLRDAGVNQIALPLVGAKGRAVVGLREGEQRGGRICRWGLRGQARQTTAGLVVVQLLVVQDELAGKAAQAGAGALQVGGGLQEAPVLHGERAAEAAGLSAEGIPAFLRRWRTARWTVRTDTPAEAGDLAGGGEAHVHVAGQDGIAGGAVIDLVLVNGESAHQEQAGVTFEVEVELQGDNDGASGGEVKDDLGAPRDRLRVHGPMVADPSMDSMCIYVQRLIRIFSGLLMCSFRGAENSSWHSQPAAANDRSICAV